MHREPLAVLLVEDNLPEARLLQALLADSRRARFVVRHVERVSAALHALAEQPCEVVVLDLSLPDAHGLGAFRAIHTAFPQLPIVILTGSEDEAMAEVALLEGAQDYLSKQALQSELVERALHYAVQRKQAEEERVALMRGQAEAEAALRVRDQFLSVASHELRTPLAALQGYVDLFLRRVKLDQPLGEREQQLLGSIRAQTARIDTLSARLLDSSRIQGGHLALERLEINLRALIERMVTTLQPTLERHTLALESLGGAQDDYYLWADELRLEQVLHNLLHNAIKYSPQGGPIIVRLMRQHDHLRLAVSDRGIGITPEALTELFQPFYRAREARAQGIAGTGLGLYIVREIIQLHGGQIEVESEPGRGSTFTVTLPIAAPPAPP